MPKNEAEFEELLALYYAPVLKKVKIANIFHVSDKQFNNVKDWCNFIKAYYFIIIYTFIFFRKAVKDLQSMSIKDYVKAVAILMKWVYFWDIL